MRRMRIRLLFGFLVLLALGHWQERGVLAQKYYMNFAFNNNNPDGADGGGDTGPNPPGDMNSGAGGQLDDGGMGDHSMGFDNGHAGGDIGDSRGGGGSGGGGGGGSGADPGDEGGLAVGTGGGYEGADGPIGGNDIGAIGRDDDNDDSDSKDPKDWRGKHEAMEEGKAKRTDHGHHSSYEVSIDDSFGGRYVRSLYESSESHGHSGASSMSGSNNRDSSRHDSSQEGRDHFNYGDQEPDEAIQAVDGNVPDGDNDDYEEM